MIYYKYGKYHISALKVHYIDEHEGEVIKYVGQEGRKWWEEFAKKWKDTFELKGFEEVEITREQIDRLEKVNELNLPEGITLIDEYVLENDLSHVTREHPLYVLVQDVNIENLEKKSNAVKLKNKILEQEVSVTNEALFELIMEVYNE